MRKDGRCRPSAQQNWEIQGAQTDWSRWQRHWRKIQRPHCQRACATGLTRWRPTACWTMRRSPMSRSWPPTGCKPARRRSNASTSYCWQTRPTSPFRHMRAPRVGVPSDGETKHRVSLSTRSWRWMPIHSNYEKGDEGAAQQASTRVAGMGA